MEPEEKVQLAILREEIRQAGNHAIGSVDRTRRLLGPLLFALGCVSTPVVALFVIVWAETVWGVDGLWAAFWYVAALALLGGLVAVLRRERLSDGSGALARLVIAWHTSLGREKVRQRLARLSPEQQAAVLIPLRNHRTAGPIIAPFLREIDAHSELTPAAAPDIRGDEPSPA